MELFKNIDADADTDIRSGVKSGRLTHHIEEVQRSPSPGLLQLTWLARQVYTSLLITLSSLPCSLDKNRFHKKEGQSSDKDV